MTTLPACSTCGFAVDWVRSCYKSRWHLFRNDLATESSGRFYFCPTNTPHYPGWHYVGSKIWLDKNHSFEQGQGEILTATQVYDDGRVPHPIPLALRVGNAECIESGERQGDALTPENTYNGFPVQCFLAIDPDIRPFIESENVITCVIQRLFARVIEFQYADATQRIDDLIHAFFGVNVVITHHAENGVFPSCVTIKSPGWSIVSLDGTRNFTQLAFQAMDSLAGPTDQGNYGTMETWLNASMMISRYMRDDELPTDTPIMLAGHSYGGAVACVLAVRLRNEQPTRRINLLTFGCPKPGDQRMINILATCNQFHLANFDDIVTVVPPDLRELEPFEFILGRNTINALARWRPPSRVFRQNEQGVIVDLATPDIGSLVLGNIINRIFDGNFSPPITGHTIEEYFRRITLRCPGGNWPINEQVKVLIDADDWHHSYGQGDLAVSGQAGTNRVRYLAGQGDLESSGKGDRLLLRLLDGQGDLESSGQGDRQVLRLLDGQGDLESSGQADMEYIPPAPTPGASCAAAGAMVVGQSYSGNAGGFGTSQWFKFPVLNGTTNKVTLSTSNGALSVALHYGTSCPPTFFATLVNPAVCGNHTSSADENIYIQVFGVFSGSTAYTITTASGSC